MSADTTSPEWTVPEVLVRLRAQAGTGRPVAAQVFLDDDMPVERLPQAAKQILEVAMAKVGKDAAGKLGKVHRLAKSFSVVADVDTLAAVAQIPGVKTILPSEVADILPRPVKPPQD